MWTADHHNPKAAYDTPLTFGLDVTSAECDFNYGKNEKASYLIKANKRLGCTEHLLETLASPITVCMLKQSNFTQSFINIQHERV